MSGAVNIHATLKRKCWKGQAICESHQYCSIYSILYRLKKCVILTKHVYIYTYAILVYRIPLGELAKVTTSGCMK